MIKRAEDQEGKHRRGQALSPQGKRLAGGTEGSEKLGNAEGVSLCFSPFLIIKKTGQQER